MLQYPLYQLLADVPVCLETNTLATVLDIFTRKQCDRLMVVNSQQVPIGLLYSARLLPQLLAVTTDDYLVNLQRPISQVDKSLLEPIPTLSAAHSLEHFTLFLKYQETKQQKNLGNLDWALVDSDGKLLGILDTLRLLQLLAENKSPIHSIINQQQELPKVHASIVHLLRQLPWPIMLQSSQGEIITQNPAWWQQLGVLKDFEAVRKQVETILSPSYVQNAADIYADQSKDQKLDPLSTNITIPPTLQELSVNFHGSSDRCVLDTHLGICTCVVEIKNGQERVWQFAKIPLDIKDLPDISESQVPTTTDDLWLILATDVTEQQQLCKELATKNADLIQLNRLKDEFLACISHELKTPLTAVLGLSRLLVDQQLGQLNERQARYAGLIHQSGRHLMSVVNDILDLTRMETGQMQLTFTLVQIQVVCERALSDVKNIYQQTHKTQQLSSTQNQNPSHRQFSLVIEPGLEQMVADELRLRQMLEHLLSNAFKFTEVSGEIGLRVSRWEGWIAFTVWDTGIGIPEQQQHLIFQKFQQLENPLTRQFEGTGLGLVLTRALARLHGGDVSFLSREGKGSQFTLLLPPSPPKLSFSDIKSQNPNMTDNSHYSRQNLYGSPQYQSHSSPRLLLVVEAVAQYIEELTEQLKALGYRVVIARSGTEALEKARRLQPKAIFLNPLLPLLSGWDVLTLLKSDSLTRHIHVVVTATAAEKDQALTKQADSFLTLPIQRYLLTTLLEQLSTPPKVQHSALENNHYPQIVPLRILRLVNPQLQAVNLYPSLREHRVIEVDDLDQADLLARVWQFDLILLDMEISAARTYLQQLTQYQRLATLPLVTCDVSTTLAASQISGLSVFPCLTPLHQENDPQNYQGGALSSVLQIAAGISCPLNILVVDVTMLHDLPKINPQPVKNYQLIKNSSLNLKNQPGNRGYEWFQALIQYLQTAGFRASIASCWSEVLQQVSHKSVDLLLICLQETSMHPEVHQALQSLGDLSFQLPPILVLDQTFHPSGDQYTTTPLKPKYTSSVETTVREIATHILPRSISMEDLLTQINHALSKVN
ncbi:MAG: ATP-binding protein [Dolichospermum sp.]